MKKDEELTQEEIQAQMAKDEAELEGYLNKFQMIPLPDSSLVEEEDEDEEDEIFTLDFDNNTAYEKIGEGVAVRDEDGNISLVNDEDLADKIKSILDKEESKEPVFKTEMNDMFTNILVSKAVASLLKKLRAAEDKITIDDRVFDGMGVLGGMLESTIVDAFFEKRAELRRCYISEWDSRVDFNRVPEWAKGYIKEYIHNMMNGLVELTERD